MRRAKKIVWILDGILLMVILSFGLAYLIGNSNVLLKDKDSETAKEKEGTQIEAENKTIPSGLPKSKITITFGGDVMLKNYHQNAYDKKGISAIVSSEVQDIVKNSDVCMVNEEFPLSSRGEKNGKKETTYRVEPQYVSFLKDLGVDIVTLANDHSLDYGNDALADTRSALDDAMIRYAGAGEDADEAEKIQYIEVNGYKIAFIAASQIAVENTSGVFRLEDSSVICQKIGEAKQIADDVIVYLHWGEENQETPKSSQRVLAKTMIDAGASAVVGCHTHCLQGMEYYKNCPIIYSLGDFVFSQTEKRVALISLTLCGEEGKKITLYPCYTRNGKTDLITKKSSIRSFQSYMESISFGISIAGDGEVTCKSR